MRSIFRPENLKSMYFLIKVLYLSSILEKKIILAFGVFPLVFKYNIACNHNWFEVV